MPIVTFGGLRCCWQRLRRRISVLRLLPVLCRPGSRLDGVNRMCRQSSRSSGPTYGIWSARPAGASRGRMIRAARDRKREDEDDLAPPPPVAAAAGPAPPPAATVAAGPETAAARPDGRHTNAESPTTSDPPVGRGRGRDRAVARTSFVTGDDTAGRSGSARNTRFRTVQATLGVP